MTQAVTFDDVWKMFQEMVRENRERSAELDRKIQETNAQMQETDRQMKETARQMRETDRQMRETDRQMQETDRKIKAVSTQLGQLGGRLGQFIEEMIKPSCLAMFQERGIMVDEIYPRAEKRLAGKEMEIDLLLANTVAAVLIEIKSHLTVEDVQEHLTRLSRFKSFFPKYSSCQTYGAVAGMVIASDADRFAMNQGLFVIAQTGDSVQLANDEAFVPKTW